MNKKEIDAWLKDLEQRDRKAAGYAPDDEDYPRWMEYHYVVVIPEDVYELLPPDEQAKFDGCDLTDWMDDEFIVDDFGVEPDELNELWQRKFYDLHDGDRDDESIWYGLGKNIKNKPVDEVLVFNM